MDATFKTPWYISYIRLIATIVGFLVFFIFGGFGRNEQQKIIWDIQNLNPWEYVMGLFVGYAFGQIFYDHFFKKTLKDFLDLWFRNLRSTRHSYHDYNPETISKFLNLVVGANEVYSIDRNDPDAWFFNDNYITFLSLQEALVRDKNTDIHRLFIWRRENFFQSRYQQLLILNVYAGIKTYIVPYEFLEDRVAKFSPWLNSKGNASLIEGVNREHPKKAEWLKYIFGDPDGEEFLLCFYNGGDSRGIGKVKDNHVKDRELTPIEREGYKLFFDWFLEITTSNGQFFSQVHKIDPNHDFLSKWKKQLEGIINKYQW